MENIIYIVTFKSQSIKKIERVCFRNFADAQKMADERNGKVEMMVLH